MVTLARRITLNTQDAHEIAQEGFLRIWIHAGKWDPDGAASFETWLRRIVTNLAISKRRRYRPQVSLDAIEEMPTRMADAFETVSDSDQKNMVLQALKSLPVMQRAAVAAYYYDEVPYAQAAEQLQISLRAFDSLLVRAKRNLRKYFAKRGMQRWEGGL